VPKDQYAGGFADQRPIRRVKGIEVRESSSSAAANLCLGSGKACATAVNDLVFIEMLQ
jgi:hypothetical protein